KLDILLKDIRIVDPACGSGAFLVGMLNEIIGCRIYLYEWILNKNVTEYELKKEAIQNCIYGVDIDPGAIEIAKLRLWLSLVVDYSVEDIEPLPNLDYHLMCGNSLLEEYEGIKFYNGEENGQQATLLVDTDKQEKITELKKKIKEYFDIHDDKEKQAKRKEINDIKDWLVRSALERRKRDLATQRKSEEAKANMLDQKSREKYLVGWGDKFLAEAKIKEVLDNLHNLKATKPFFIWKLEFIDVFEDKKGFDVVIANPPYLSSKNINEELKPFYEKIFYSPVAHYDIYIIFIERALQLLKVGGDFCFITSNKYFSQKYGSKIREILLTKQLLRIINFNFKIFEATVDTCITIVKNSNYQAGNKVKILDLYDTDLKNSDISSLGEIIIDEERYSIIKQDFFKELPELNFRLDVYRQDFNLRQKIYKETIALAEICFVIYGAVLHNAEKNVKKEEFIYQEKQEKDIDLKPYVEGKFISRWRINKIFYLKYIPGIHREPRYPELFENCKLLGKRIIGREGLSFLYDQQNFYTDNTVYIIIPYYLLPRNKYSQLSSIINDNRVKLSKEYSLLFLLSIINSSLFKWLFQKFFSFGLDIYPAHIKKLPVKITTQKEQKPFIEIVDKIMAVTKTSDYLENSAKQVKVKEYEKQIDQMVYKLYGLTSEEIKIVEGE
ncbi:MAG: N-6 DNA methylase, partial [bacterium]